MELRDLGREYNEESQIYSSYPIYLKHTLIYIDDKMNEVRKMNIA